MKKTPAALLLAGITTALLAVALPAQAAPPALPAGDHLVAASCGEDDTAYELATFIGIDTATGASTPVGAGNPGFGCSYQQAWDPTTGTLYGVIYDSNMNLVTWDYTTGVVTDIGELHDSVTDAPVYPGAIFIDLDGKAYGIAGSALFSIDLATAAATDLGSLAGVDAFIYGAAVDPTTGLAYALEESGDLLLIDPLAVTSTFVATWPTATNFSYGLAIDHAGTAWVVENPGTDGAYSALWSTPLATFGVDPQLSGNILDADGDDPVTWWATIIYPPAPVAPAPALAATGFDAAPLALGGILLAAAGAALVTRRSRRIA